MDNFTALSNLILDEDFQKLNQLRNKKTFFDIMGIASKEVPFTKLLAWLLDPHADHQMGTFPLESFLRYCLRYEKENKDKISALQIEDLNFSDVSVYAEYPINAENDSDEQENVRGRLDIYCDYTLKTKEQTGTYPLLLIEAKIGASQHNSQTERYQRWVRQQSDGSPPFRPILIYLTPAGDIDETIASDFVPMDFTSLNLWLEILIQRSKSPQADFLLTELYRFNSNTGLAQSLELDELAERIRENNQASVEQLTGQSSTQFDSQVMEKYRPAFDFLDLFTGRSGSLGPDEHIAIVKDAIAAVIGNDQRWQMSGTGSLSVRYLPLQEVLNQDVRGTNMVNMYLWMDRSSNSLNFVTHCVRNGMPEGVDHRQVAISLAEEGRKLCAGLEKALKIKSGKSMQIASIDLPRGNTTPESAIEKIMILQPLTLKIEAWLKNGGFNEWRGKILLGDSSLNFKG